MGVVVDLDDRRLNWWNYKATCCGCGHRWYGVVREDTPKEELQCSRCGSPKSVVCSTDEEADDAF